MSNFHSIVPLDKSAFDHNGETLSGCFFNFDNAYTVNIMRNADGESFIRIITLGQGLKPHPIDVKNTASLWKALGLNL